MKQPAYSKSAAIRKSALAALRVITGGVTRLVTGRFILNCTPYRREPY